MNSLVWLVKFYRTMIITIANMKYLKIVFAILCLIVNVNVMAQTPDDEKYEMTQKFASVDEVIYLKALNRTFKFDTLCADDILITHINGKKIKNKYITYSEIRTYLTKSYPEQKTFKLKSEANNGYVLVIGQYGKNKDIPIRYWTLFMDITGKIVVIEIEENNL